MEPDELLNLFDDSGPDTDDVVVAPTPARGGLPPASDISVISVNYFENEHPKTTWLNSNRVFALQFFTETRPFKPSKLIAANNATAQLHDAEFWMAYIDNYKAENEGSRFTPTADQMGWYNDLYTETIGMPRHGGGPLLGQVYDHKGGGTNYHWGSVARMVVNRFDEIKLELFVECERFALIDVSAPNTDKSLKTAKIKFRGRYDPYKLWMSKGTKR